MFLEHGYEFAVTPNPLCLSRLGFLHFSGRESAVALGGHADLRSERDAGEILDPLLLLHVLRHQLLWKGTNKHY